jgi:hypothetical protein
MRYVNSKTGAEIQAESSLQAVEIALNRGNENPYHFNFAGYFQDEYEDGATEILFSDRRAYTIIRRTAKTITVQRDKVTRDPSFQPIMDGCHMLNQDRQSWICEQDPEGQILTLRWSEKYHYYQRGAVVFIPGRHEFHDYNF